MTRQNDKQIRLATHADAGAIAAVLHDSFIEYEKSYTANGFAATTPTAEQIKNRMNEGPSSRLEVELPQKSSFTRSVRILLLR
jgi:hypothetical protein